MNRIPVFMTNFNIYADSSKLVGVSGDVTLPKFDAVGDTVSGAGILGEFEEPVPGQFKSQQLEIGFRVIDRTMFEVAAATGITSLTLRGSQQINDYTNGGLIDQSVRIESRGGVKSIELGKASVGKATDSKLSMEIRFIAVYLDDEEVLYLDKLNYIYRVDGTDLTAGVRANI